MKIDLQRADGGLPKYPAYEGQELVLVHSPNSDEWYNAELVSFPACDAGYALIRGAIITAGSHHLFVPTSLVHLIAGMTCEFRPGDIRISGIDMSALEGEFVKSALEIAPMPTNCKKCNLFNEYVGLEHLINGDYVCRGCR